jgi:uncharacterized membrane protein
MSRCLPLIGACVGFIVLAACSKSTPPVPPTAAPDVAPVPAPTISPTATSELPADSGLALKRGMLTLAAKHATFQPCGTSTQLWVIDQTDGVLRQTFANEPIPLELYVEAHGERTAVPETIPAASAHPGAFILEEVLYATQPAETQGCKEAAPTYIVTARGNEPFWSVEVMADKMVWRQPESPTEVTIEAPQSQDSEGTVGYVGAASGHKLELFIDEQPCRDSMSNAFFAYSARAVFDGKELKGCARIGE